MGSHRAWRRLIVRNDITFSQFHDVIQTAFKWEDSHLYHFEIGDDEIEIGSELLETRLGERLEIGTKFKYVYDFGDNWEHDVVVERTIEGYSTQHATCLDGEHPGPPEDVGGIPGYLEFLRIINDKNDPDHPHMKLWASLWKPEFDIVWVNRKLERLA
ncbi:plasmid pRiA4b ORF-3 family protein [Alkalibacillus silvisoli]|uniref:Plasmid pRiA4b ORF-3 family protein n=1 Tax=Alkalibacillus silvisoli TaxID=392823 RepID=A0ABP3K3H0_9BACI